METNAPFQGIAMILVEDDALLRDSYAMFLRIRGFQVRAFADAEEALASVEVDRFDFDIVVSDYRLLGVDGLTLLKRIGESHPGTLRVLITAHPSAGVFHEANRIGVDEILLKPFSTGEMERALQRLIGDRGERSGI